MNFTNPIILPPKEYQCLIKFLIKSIPQKALNRGEYTADAIVVIGAIALSVYYLGSIMPAVAIIAGLIVGLIIGIITEVYTSGDYGSVKKIAEQSETGAATTIISGIEGGRE